MVESSYQLPTGNHNQMIGPDPIIISGALVKPVSGRIAPPRSNLSEATVAEQWPGEDSILPNLHFHRTVKGSFNCLNLCLYTLS